MYRVSDVCDEQKEKILSEYVTKRLRTVVKVSLQGCGLYENDPLTHIQKVYDKDGHLTEEAINILERHEKMGREFVPETVSRKNIHSWLRNTSDELLDILNDEKETTTPSLNGEYFTVMLVCGYIDLLKTYGEDPDDGFAWKADLTSEIEKFIEEDILLFDTYDDENYESYIRDRLRNTYTDIRCWIGTHDAPSFTGWELLLWDHDFKLLNEIPESRLRDFDEEAGLGIFI